MAVSFARFGRFLRSIFAPTAAIFGFSCLLTFIFVLYQPHPGPGALQRLGWQSWDVVTDGLVGQSPASALETTAPDNDGTDGTVPAGVDWWNVSTGAETIDTASLPLDVWDPLMQHDTGREWSRCICCPLLETACNSVRDTHNRMRYRPLVRSIHCSGSLLSLDNQRGRCTQGQVGPCGT